MLCHACRQRQRPLGRPVCQGCWVTLPRATRAALMRVDDRRGERRLQLDRAIEAGTELRLIDIR